MGGFLGGAYSQYPTHIITYLLSTHLDLLDFGFRHTLRVVRDVHYIPRLRAYLDLEQLSPCCHGHTRHCVYCGRLNEDYKGSEMAGIWDENDFEFQDVLYIDALYASYTVSRTSPFSMLLLTCCCNSSTLSK